MPFPDKHVLVCMQSRPPGHPRPACAASGCGEVFEEFMWQQQQRGLFQEMQITGTFCLGPCGGGPTLLVYPERVMYSGVKKEDVATIIEQHLLGGKPVEHLRFVESL